MGKKLLIFSSAFCLSIILLQLLKPEVKIDSIEVPSNLAISNNSSTIRSEYQISIEYRDSFKNLLDKFQNAVARNDKETILSLISFPVDVEVVGKKNKPYNEEIRSEKEFLQSYDKIFDDPLKQCISQIDTKLLFSSSGEVFVMSGGRMSVRMKRFYKTDNANVEVKIIRLYRC